MPRFIASDVPIMVTASSMLLQIFTAPPVPTAPQWVTLAPMWPSSLSAWEKTASVSAPTMKVRVPAAAALTPPEIQKVLKPTRAKCNNREFSNKILNHIKLPHIFHSAMKKIHLCYLLLFNVKLTRNVWQVRNSVIALIHWNIRFYI